MPCIRREFIIPDIIASTKIDFKSSFISHPTLDFIKIVRAKTNISAISTTIDKIKEHKVDASSSTEHSLLFPRALETPLKRLKESLYKRREIITGRVIITITIIATTPQELFIKEMLDEIVFKESPKNPPTIGIKFPIANRAVLSESVSTP